MMIRVPLTARERFALKSRRRQSRIRLQHYESKGLQEAAAIERELLSEIEKKLFVKLPIRTTRPQ